ncbi:unnamed protein product [Meloidogyne enterolobii]|uniref:Uncharacterized protein n=1 Tax=Meloidogyne enterolobii TaxID=390850 RepID=A0ACB0Z0W5_MELEN
MSNGHQQQIITENNNPNIRRYISQLYVIPAVDASEAGKGQLEISVNQGQVPNNVQMQDAGRCLVTFIPQHAGTYVIDVTFNGLQVHGCPIKVDVRERQVGKPVSAPVYARPTTSTSSPPPTRGPSSSAYFSSASPQAAPSPSYTAAAPSPSSTPQLPRSPPLVAGVEAALLGGYTVAQYGNGGGGGIPSTTKLKPSPLSTPPSTRPKPKLFEEKEIPISRPSMPESAQLEMTRSAEMTLFRDIPKTPVTTPVEAGREIPIQHSFERIPEQQHYQPKENPIKITQKFNDLPYAPLDQNIKKTLELLNQQQQQGIIREREIIAPPISSSAISPISTESGAPQIQTHIVDPYSSDIEAMTPGTRRRLLEHSVYKATELKETPTDHEESETALSSKQSSKATTPKLSLKFRGSKDKVGSITPPTMTTATISAATASDAFDWGKSKIASKHEVVRRGKEVDVRIDSLKLGKEDQLYVIVLPPGIIPRQNMPNELPTSEQALPHKLKKSGTKSWEISFRPSVVGTHKVHLFVNTIPHPQSPFPIRVYDASQIVVGDIVRQSVLNDTVEFTVDAGRAGFGNLEMAIKDNEGIIIPSHVSQLEAGAAKFLVTFTPNLPGTHTVHITFNKEVVTGSPFEVHIVEPQILGQESQISKKSKKKDKKSKEKHSLNGTQRGEPSTAAMSPTASGRPMVSKLPSLSRVGQPVDLLVTLSRPDDLVQAQVFDLDREPLNIETFPDYSNNTCKLQFIPKRVGDHEVEIRVAGTEIDGSPFTCRVYDPTKILVGNIPDGAVDKPVSFVVDASQAGVGNLEVAVNEGKIPSMAYALGQHKYEITFIPKDPIDHRVSVRFNNEYVPGSPFLCRLINTSSSTSSSPQQQQLPQKQLSSPKSSPPRQIGASGAGLERIPVGQPTEFFVDGQSLIEGIQTTTTDLLPKVQIIDPRGELLPVDIAAYEEEPSRSIIRYTPKSVGNHQIFVKLNNQPIPGSPFIAKAFDASCVKLALESEGGQVGRSCAFTIDAAKAGAGNMEIIVSVEKRNVPNYVQPEGQAKFRVTFTPQEALEHLISVKFNGISVPGNYLNLILNLDSLGSPLSCPIQPSSVQRSPRPVRAGSELPIQQQLEEQQQLLVVPQQPTSVETRGEEEEEEKEIKLVGDLASAIVDEPKRFSIDAPPGIGRKVECNVIVVGPHKRRIPVDKQRVDGGSFDITFTPTQIGNYHIDIQINGKSLAICPILCKCLDSRKMPKITNGEGEPLQKGNKWNGPFCGKDFMFEVKLPKRTKKDQLITEMFAFPLIQQQHKQQQKINIPVNLDMHPNGESALCSFRALPKPHNYLFTLYRDACILDERSFDAIPESTNDEPIKLVEFIQPVLVEHSARFLLAKTGKNIKLLDEEGLPELQIFDILGNELPVHIRIIDGNTVRADWQPQTEGKHQLFIRDRFGNNLCGSPLIINVLDLSAVRVIGLRNGDVVGVEQKFTLDWSNSGGQSASVSICHVSDNEPVKSLMMKRVKKGIHSIAFTPRLPGLHLITAKIDGVELPECPYECIISDRGSPRARGDALNRAQRGKTARFEVSPGTSGSGATELDVIVTNPQGSPLPVRCYKQQDDSYWVEFTPEICGPHRIEVTFGDEPLIGSPFLCEVIDPKRVYVRGIDRPFSLRTLSNFIVSRKAAGDGALNVELVDSQNETLKLDRTKNSVGEDSFTFLPTRLGVHRLSVRLAGFAIPSSPFQIVVEEQKTSPTVYGAALDYSIERAQQASMIFDANKQPGGLKVEVKSPSGEKVRYTTNRRPDETTEIAFRPQEIGIYEVNIEFNNRLVNGSPFPVTVVDPTKVLIISDDRKQIIRPDGMLQLFVGQRNVINLDCSEAGPAKIRAEVRDADGELLPLEQQTQVHPLDNGKFQLLFTPRKSGKYKIYLYCSELVVPNAYPILAIAEQSNKMPTHVSEMNGERQRRHKEVVEEAAESEIIERKELILGNVKEYLKLNKKFFKVKLRGSGLTTARIKEPAEFILDASNLRKDAMGKCTATLLGDRADIPVKLSALGNQVYKGVYTPLVDGKYQLSVKIDGTHVPGSPSIVNVKAPEISPAQLIEVDGRPLKMGILGEDMQTLIDARRAGPGQISAQCSGTSQLEYCELLDNGDGTYMLRIQPKELGKHTLSVKYENEHVRDIKVYGPGIEHGILHSFKSNFVVETKGAGAGQLTVRVRGPKGAFNVEMQRDREQERTIHCKYEPREPGDYQVEVKWHGQHVPGSPFFVLIVDTEQELHRFLAGGIPSPTPTSPFVPPGWLPPGPPGLMPGPHPGAPPLPIMPSPIPPPHFMKGSRLSPGGPMPPPPPPHAIFQQHPAARGFGGPPPPQHPHQPIYGKPHF